MAMFLPGQRVTIIEGPYKGWTGKVLSVTDAERLWARDGVKPPANLADPEWEWLEVTIIGGRSGAFHVQSEHLTPTVD